MDMPYKRTEYASAYTIVPTPDHAPTKGDVAEAALHSNGLVDITELIRDESGEHGILGYLLPDAGLAENPQVWALMQRGELGRFHGLINIYGSQSAAEADRAKRPDLDLFVRVMPIHLAPVGVR